RRTLRGAGDGRARPGGRQRLVCRALVAPLPGGDEAQGARGQVEQVAAERGEQVHLAVVVVRAAPDVDVLARGIADVTVAERVDRGAGRIVVRRVGVGVDRAHDVAVTVARRDDRVVVALVPDAPAAHGPVDPAVAAGHRPV